MARGKKRHHSVEVKVEDARPTGQDLVPPSGKSGDVKVGPCETDKTGSSPGLRAQSHSEFFDHLVDLIPAKYYHESDFEVVNPRYLKKAEKAAAKMAAKEAYKKAKRAKLDPDQAKTSLEVQKEKDELKKREAPGNEAPAGLQFNIGSSTAASREELKERLQARLEELRKQREIQKRKDNTAKAKAWLSRERDKSRQRAQLQLAKGSRGGAPGASTGNAEEVSNLKFGNIKTGGPEGNWKKKKHQKPSKEVLLERAKAKKERAAALANTAEGEAKAHTEAWSVAMARARGEKVLDDPKLLRRSLKKEKRAKDKSRSAWEERKQKEVEQKEAKQQKRRENLKKRADSKIQKKKDKRDKKLLRPGFEGRKAGSIQKSG